MVGKGDGICKALFCLCGGLCVVGELGAKRDSKLAFSCCAKGWEAVWVEEGVVLVVWGGLRGLLWCEGGDVAVGFVRAASQPGAG